MSSKGFLGSKLLSSSFSITFSDPMLTKGHFQIFTLLPISCSNLNLISNRKKTCLSQACCYTIIAVSDDDDEVTAKTWQVQSSIYVNRLLRKFHHTTPLITMLDDVGSKVLHHRRLTKLHKVIRI